MGYASHEYCDMANTRCGTRGWMRVANLDMTDTSQHCLSGFRYASGSGYRGCGTHGVGCVHTTFPVHGVRYSKVCGRVNAYQYYSPDAFWPYYTTRALTIDSAYVEGVRNLHVPVVRPPLRTLELCLHSLARTTSATLAVDITMQTECIIKIHFGMGVAVDLRAPVVSSTTLHGSARTSLNQRLMTLSWWRSHSKINRSLCTVAKLNIH